MVPAPVQGATSTTLPAAVASVSTVLLSIQPTTVVVTPRCMNTPEAIYSQTMLRVTEAKARGK